MSSSSGSRSASTIAASALLIVEGIGIAVLAAWQVVELFRGEVMSLASSIALIVMTLAAAAGVCAFGVGVAAGHSWGRSGGIVVQAMIFAIAIGAITGEFANLNAGMVLGIPAVVTFVLLLAAARAARPPAPEKL
ncbi:histidine kinase [Microbacterium amylolyticum]|uniref:Histidine kinase n=1 Tax=Microbacterium amylolyticum TaxID=936337 RepID=A0ABS4ZMD0_9MICO|nr:histidine kinase [Microbacterium amylolyticum]MBP2437611.1 hypothetical protein [Microbacterium amylolyticum]